MKSNFIHSRWNWVCRLGVSGSAVRDDTQKYNEIRAIGSTHQITLGIFDIGEVFVDSYLARDMDFVEVEFDSPEKQKKNHMKFTFESRGRRWDQS